MNLADFLKTLTAALRCSALQVDTQGACLVDTHNLSFLFEWDDLLIQGTVLLSCALCPLNHQARDLSLKTLLQHNALGSGILSLKDDTIYLHTRIHPSIDVETLEALIMDFVATATQMRELIPTLKAQPPESQGMTPSSFKA